MPYCTNCGEEVTPDQRFCSYCGERVNTDDRPDRPRHSQQSEPRQHNHSPGKRQDGPATARGQQPHESPVEQTRTHEREAGQRGAQPGTVAIYTDSLRAVFRQPLALFALFIAWFVVSALVLLPPAAGTLAGLLAAGIGLVAAGILYVTTEADETGTERSLTSAYAQVATLSVVGVWLVYVVGVSIGLSLFILPGLYLGGRLLLAFPACVLEDTGTAESLKQSWHLTKGVTLQPIGFLLLGILTMIVLAILLSFPQAFVFAIAGVEIAEFESLDAAVELLDDPTFVLINAFFQAIVLAIPAGAVQIAATRLYLQRRDDGRRDRQRRGVDEEQSAQQHQTGQDEADQQATRAHDQQDAQETRGDEDQSVGHHSENHDARQQDDKR